MIRRVLLADLKDLHRSDAECKVVEELGINHGSVRADIAVINGAMNCYEIKSDKDNLLRLPEQICAYNAIFDRTTIVVGQSHVLSVIEMVPDWWGITLARASIGDEVDLKMSTIRAAQPNNARDCLPIARLLWRHEALGVLTELEIDKGLRSKPKKFIYDALVKSLELESLSQIVRSILRSRQNWRAA